VDRGKKTEIDLKREISFIINNKAKDPRIGFITVTGAKLSSDHKWLDVFVSILGDQEKITSSLEGLSNCCGFIKKNQVKKFRLKSIPNIKFIYDRSIDHGLKITELLKKLNKASQE